jgi:hypothetical protein
MTTPSQAEGIIILGAPRSGTTLLRRLIDAHPRIACPGETNVFTACGRFLRSERLADGTGIGILDGLSYAGFAADDVLERLRELAFSFHREYARRQAKPRWASKTAFDAFYLAELEQLCGDHVAFVCIQRHGLDVACSLEELCNKNGVYLRELHDYIVRERCILDAFALAWVDLARAIDAFAKRHQDNAIVVTYEELTADPDATMARIMTRLGDTWDPAWVVQALQKREALGLGDWKTYGRHAVDPASVGRWKGLPSETVRRLAAICNPTLALCGYEPVEGGSDLSPEERRRHYEIGLRLQGLKPTPGRSRD